MIKDQIDKYFKSLYKKEWVDYNKRDKNGEWIKDETGTPKTFYRKDRLQIKIPTLAGLALELNITVDELMDIYNEILRPNYITIYDVVEIKKAITKIRKEYELRLINRGNEGDIFGLKQFIK